MIRRKELLTALPKEAVDRLIEMYVEKRDLRDPRSKVEVVPDPKVAGTFAVQLTRYIPAWKCTETFQLLWYSGGYDECEFSCWPPVSNGLQIFN